VLAAARATGGADLGAERGDGAVTRSDRAQTLRWLGTAVVAAGLVAVGGVLVALNQNLTHTSTWLLPALTGLVAVASAAVVRARLRSTVFGTAWTDAATLICIVWLPSAWVPLCVGTGVLVAKLLRRVSPFKAAYNAAKDALAATAGLAVAIHLGVADTGFTGDPLQRPWQLAVVALTVAAAENLVGVPVLAAVSRTPWHRVLRTDGDIKLASFAGKFAVAVLTLKLLDINGRLLAVIPPVALCLHLMYSGRVRARAERAAWRRLAATTEDLNNTDLSAVLSAAVVNAAKLFAADEAEVFLRDSPDGPVLVRGDADGVSWSGDPGRAPPRRHDGEGVTARLAGPDVKADIGEVRLHYAGRVAMTDRDRLALRTFVSALRTAVRNAAAFAEARRLALRNSHAALHDPLTGLANRRRLREQGESMLSRTGVTALVTLDLDLFREVNETLGYLAGDRLLAEVARRLAAATTGPDIVARLGGDEFAALLVGLPSAAGAERRARELLATLDAPVDLGGMRVRVEASAGIAVADETLEPGGGSLGGMVELLRRADVAMHRAKRGGPRVVCYDPSLDTTDVAQLMLGGDLPRAITDHEFAVSFQPIVDLTTGDMISAEALARWRHPDRGDLDPRRFLAPVERSGLLPAFAEAVLDQALAAVKRWQAAGIAAPVAVNASPRSLLDPSFARMVIDRLAAHGVPGSDLVIELTETLTLSQVDLVGGVLAQLREAGVRLALDDFGTGYSSLAMLGKVPVHELKIDRSFVMALLSAPEAAAVVRSTIELGRSLDLLVVAEGVERPDQRQMLWDLGCAAGQGHLFARPMAIDALLERIGTGTDGVPGRLAPPLTAGVVVRLARAGREQPAGDADPGRRRAEQV
jgi:diguanylate cyclase